MLANDNAFHRKSTKGNLTKVSNEMLLLVSKLVPQDVTVDVPYLHPPKGSSWSECFGRDIPVVPPMVARATSAPNVRSIDYRH